MKTCEEVFDDWARFKFKKPASQDDKRMMIELMERARIEPMIIVNAKVQAHWELIWKAAAVGFSLGFLIGWLIM